jgi:hypothetical protein
MAETQTYYDCVKIMLFAKTRSTKVSQQVIARQLMCTFEKGGQPWSSHYLLHEMHAWLDCRELEAARPSEAHPFRHLANRKTVIKKGSEILH